MNAKEHMIDIVTALAAYDPVEYAPIALPNWWNKTTGEYPDFQSYVYRRTPPPDECWMNIYTTGPNSHHDSEIEAKKMARRCTNITRMAVHMREITDEDNV